MPGGGQDARRRSAGHSPSPEVPEKRVAERAAQQVVGTPLVDFPDVTASTEPSFGALCLRQAGDLLAAEPTVLAGALIGYARDSA